MQLVAGHPCTLVLAYCVLQLVSGPVQDYTETKKTRQGEDKSVNLLCRFGLSVSRAHYLTEAGRKPLGSGLHTVYAKLHWPGWQLLLPLPAASCPYPLTCSMCESIMQLPCHDMWRAHAPTCRIELRDDWHCSRPCRRACGVQCGR